jgi:putative membrane protein
MKILVGWTVNAVALYATARLVPGILLSRELVPVFMTAAVIGLLNAVVKPVLVVLTLPVTILTLGLFHLVLNAFLFWLASALTPEAWFRLDGFWPALLGAVVMSLVAMVLHALVPGD